MTLEEAIKHCEERAKICDECGKEHKRLAEWLEELRSYQEIGTVEECREAVEKQKAKKPHIDANELLGDTSYECPNCGTEMMLIDRNRIQWGHIQKYCECCGQAILRME